MPRLLLSFLLFFLSLTGYCKTYKIYTHLRDSSFCEKTVKYKINLIKKLDSLKTEVKVDFEIIINPGANQINILTKGKNKTLRTITTTIVKTDCAVDDKLQNGKITYRGYVYGANNVKYFSTISIFFNNGILSIEESDPESNRASNYTMKVSKLSYF